MLSRVVPLVCASGAALLLWGCSLGPNFIAQYEPWRDEEERACLASGYVQDTPWLVSRSALGGPSVCGALHPFVMSAADSGRVSLKPAATLRCTFIPTFDRWVRDVVEPETLRFYGVPVVEVKVLASYGCRPMNNISGSHLSEHGHANAIDIGGFVLANGMVITVKEGWHGNERDATFLRTVHNKSCNYFTTVLGPDYNHEHVDHFHLDLMRRSMGSRLNSCK